MAAAPLRVRLLRAEDADIYRTLRLMMLKDHPAGFGSSYEEECDLSVADFEKRLDDPATPASRLFFGGFTGDDELVATAGIVFDLRRKESHRSHLVAVYVKASERGRGRARPLVRTCIDTARGRAGIEIVFLKVTATNLTAKNLYRGFGFTTYGVEPNSAKIAGVAYDAELMALALSGHALTDYSFNLTAGALPS